MPSKKAQLIIDAMHDIQAQDIVCVNIEKMSDIADTMIICSSKSHRHARSILDAILSCKSSIDDDIPTVEGSDYAEWILVDYHDVVIHIMLPNIREYYALEKLWDKHLSENV